MSRSKKPRKAYRAGPLVNTLAFIAPPSKADRELELAHMRSSLDTIVAGRCPSEVEWRSLAEVCNWVETMAMSTGQLQPIEVMPTVCDAVEAMRGAAQRFGQGKSLRLTGPGINALAQVIDIYAQALEGLSAAEMAKVHAQCALNIARQIREHPEREVIAL